MPMWDPGGAKLPTWLPHVHEHLRALQGSIYESVWMSDHLVPGAPWAPPEWDTLECITALIHFASLYPQFRYGQIVLGNSFRPPGLLAKSISTLTALTGARVILGIGAGWMESEYRMYGYAYPTPKIRMEQLEDAAHILRAIWSDSPATYEGKHLSIDRGARRQVVEKGHEGWAGWPPGPAFGACAPRYGPHTWQFWTCWAVFGTSPGATTDIVCGSSVEFFHVTVAPDFTVTTRSWNRWVSVNETSGVNDWPPTMWTVLLSCAALAVVMARLATTAADGRRRSSARRMKRTPN